jgi:hypothetical protein
MNGACERIGVGLDQNNDIIAGCVNPAHKEKGDAPSAPRGPVVLLDTMWSGPGGLPNPKLLARNAYISMIETAQNVADRYSLTPRGDRRLRAALAATRQGLP